MNEPQSILIVKMSSIGDVVHSLPLLHALRQRFPAAFMGWVVDRRCKGILENDPHIDHLFVFEREKWGIRRRLLKTSVEVAGLIHAIRAHKFQLALDLQGLFRSGFITYFSGARTRMGFANAREMSCSFYNVKIEVPEDRKLHAVDRYMLMGRKLGIEAPGDRFALETAPHQMERVEALLSANGIQTYHRIVLINPWARWESKRWPLHKFALLADILNCEADTRVVVVGARSDLAEFKNMSSMMRTRIISLVGMTDLSELACLMKRADILITNDSGPMHIAAAAGTPVVAIFGPTDPSLCGPYGEGHLVVRKELPCSNCYCEVCPQEHQCMTSISLGEVIGEVKSKLNAIHRST
jgi:lipopolysaccharide heptosyltransferase I